MNQSIVRSRRMRSLMLWGGLIVAVFAGEAMMASRYLGVGGATEAMALAIIGSSGLLGLAGVVAALRRSADWASNSETARLLEWLDGHESELRRAEVCVSIDDFRRTVEGQLSTVDVEALFGGGGDIACALPGRWAERVQWDELFDALPRRGSRRQRHPKGKSLPG